MGSLNCGGEGIMASRVRHNSRSSPDERTSLLTDAHRNSNEPTVHLFSSSQTCTSHTPEDFERDDGFLSSNSYIDSDEHLKRKIKYFFMNPLEKWKTKGKLPYKFLLQLIKIVFVTLLLVVFGNDGQIFEIQKQNTVATFRHIFLKDWTPIREVVSYPPATGPYALYTKPDFFDHVDYVVKMYSNITHIAVIPYKYNIFDNNMTEIDFCRFEFLMVSEENTTLIFDNRVVKICQKIPPLYPAGDVRWKNFSFHTYLTSLNDSIKFERFISADLTFSLYSVFLKESTHSKTPDCFKFVVSINYNNGEHDGQVLVSLVTSPTKLHCHTKDNFNENDKGYSYRLVLNIIVIIVSSLSFLLCLRCLCKGYMLCKATDKYFTFRLHKPMTSQEKLDFVDGWYIMMVINDLMIITGTILKACIEKRTVEGDQYATCAILIGFGNLLAWAGILRYLGFFSKYNILMFTLKRAIPNVLRFMLCCVLLYCGFVFCGWIVMGPYHIKFRSLSSTSECLFALMNGDDLFATFAITNSDSLLVWYFSRIYLYSFISMFIYVVTSLFISVIMDSYETVKDHYRHGSIPTRIDVLVADCTEDSCSTFYHMRRNQRPSAWSVISDFWHRRRD